VNAFARRSNSTPSAVTADHFPLSVNDDQSLLLPPSSIPTIHFDWLDRPSLRPLSSCPSFVPSLIADRSFPSSVVQGGGFSRGFAFSTAYLAVVYPLHLWRSFSPQYSSWLVRSRTCSRPASNCLTSSQQPSLSNGFPFGTASSEST
jgi:hypothetical protein